MEIYKHHISCNIGVFIVFGFSGDIFSFLFVPIPYAASADDGEALVDKDREGATAMPIFCPAVVEGEQAVELALSDGNFPVVDKLVDVFAVASAPGEFISIISVYVNFTLAHSKLLIQACIVIFVVSVYL